MFYFVDRINKIIEKAGIRFPVFLFFFKLKSNLFQLLIIIVNRYIYLLNKIICTYA